MDPIFCTGEKQNYDATSWGYIPQTNDDNDSYNQGKWSLPTKTYPTKMCKMTESLILYFKKIWSMMSRFIRFIWSKAIVVLKVYLLPWKESNFLALKNTGQRILKSTKSWIDSRLETVVVYEDWWIPSWFQWLLICPLETSIGFDNKTECWSQCF